jgi:hypothetical protein
MTTTEIYEIYRKSNNERIRTTTNATIAEFYMNDSKRYIVKKYKVAKTNK